MSQNYPRRITTSFGHLTPQLFINKSKIIQLQTSRIKTQSILQFIVENMPSLIIPIILIGLLYIPIVNACGSGRYTAYDSDGSWCAPCQSPCSDCIGQSNGNCLTCVFGWRLQKYKPYQYGSCLDESCPDGTYLKSYNNCQPCNVACSLCFGYGSSSCAACKEGYYQSSQTSCSPCPNKCQTCIGPSSNLCRKCKDKNYFNMTDSSKQTGTCDNCHYSCKSCNASGETGCLTCDDDKHRIPEDVTKCICDFFFMDDSSGNQELCIKLVCVHGSGQSVNSTGRCSVVCGDGLVGAGEQCDDNNTLSSDGCSNQCTVENNFQCYEGNTTTSSKCKYELPIQLKFVSVTKDPFSNSLKMVLWTNTTCIFMQRLDYNTIIDFGFPNYFATFTYHTNGTIDVELNYTNHLYQNEQPFVMKVDFTHEPILSNVSILSIGYIPRSTNNLAINYYSSSMYDLIQIVQKFTKALVWTGIGIFSLSLLRGKIIGIELISSIQISFIGLSLLRFTQPLFYPLSKLVYTNGYDLGIFPRNSTGLPTYLVGIGVQRELISNMNIMLALPVLMIAVYLVLLVTTKCNFNKNTIKTIIHYKRPFGGEYLLTSLVFLETYVTFCLGVTIRYFQSIGIMLYISFAAGGVFIAVLFAVVIIYKLKDQSYFGQFRLFFKSTEPYPFYFSFHILQILVIGLVLGTFGSSYISGIICGGLLLAHCVFVGVYRPYIILMENVRSILVMLGTALNLAVCTYMNMRDPTYKEGNWMMYSPFIILGVLSFSCLISFFAVSIQLVRVIQIQIEMMGIGMDTNDAPDEKQEQIFERQMKKRMQQSKKPMLDFSKMIHKTRKKNVNRPFVLQTDPIEIGDDGNRLLERIMNFQKYQQEWRRNENIRKDNIEIEMAQVQLLQKGSVSVVQQDSEKGNQKQ